MYCFACGGPYHEATGHFFREWDLVYCGPCYRHFITEFVKPMMNRWRWSKMGNFYDHALTSTGAQRIF